MASVATFFENLWLSIFEPGPTPTLLVATNASFAALQLLFFTLLIATNSIHFYILSALCGGLWYAINWFAGEIRAAQAKEEEAKRIREAKRDKEKERAGARDADAMDSGDDTEGVETEVEEKQKPKIRANPPRAPRPETESTVFVEKPPVESVATLRGSTPVADVGASSGLKPVPDDKVKQRRSLGESTGDLSTDSEWEKLSQDSGER
ncbi:Pkr1-domain-containing protein [Bimuria novae-zelandiae CBS 107.79]|uniref:Pkr1-domain-containing protein n=1 Tax=Bimuria novae-zelandiae CBS 107.79 TaxID=1447943 RepID=A0A6A5VQP0_9PLEO|nr:Pkr1-domain-containing protein [Bimuria novae-zelandiae CBS 107.79]